MIIKSGIIGQKMGYDTKQGWKIMTNSHSLVALQHFRSTATPKFYDVKKLFS
jgi:hypothetical protein